MNRSIRLAIIDDGVNSSLYDINIKHNLEISENGTINSIEENRIQPYSHGSICAAIIQKHKGSSYKVRNKTKKPDFYYGFFIYNCFIFYFQ